MTLASSLQAGPQSPFLSAFLQLFGFRVWPFGFLSAALLIFEDSFHDPIN
jgi:hypothetical protein